MATYHMLKIVSYVMNQHRITDWQNTRVCNVW